jgi:methionyl aminopeptidase
VLAVEPIVAASARRCIEMPNRWTVSSDDGGMTAHFEHTVVIGKGQPRILTAT